MNKCAPHFAARTILILFVVHQVVIDSILRQLFIIAAGPGARLAAFSAFCAPLAALRS